MSKRTWTIDTAIGYPKGYIATRAGGAGRGLLEARRARAVHAPRARRPLYLVRARAAESLTRLPALVAGSRR